MKEIKSSSPSPYHSDSFWPTYRRTLRNNANSPLRANYQDDHPWFFQTGKGIFSTPIIDEQNVIYVGSADHHFYAIDSAGQEKWRFRTGEVIDSAGALPADDPGTILFPSGDGFLYRLNREDGSLIWKFDARTSPRMSYNNWFEGNIVLGPDGTIYAGNTNFNYYAITPDGQLKWTYETDSNAWSAGAIAADGTIYWGSCDTFFHAVSPNGQRKWKRRTLGFISASPAIGLDGTVYAGSFDSNFYALDPQTGKVRWKFKTNDHIYSSAALLESEEETELILFSSTDGILYAVTPDGELSWQYDTGAPIRSSPVIGNKPQGEAGQIVYFGNGDGKLYALDVQTGQRRWSYDTTGAGDAHLDRNDLNGSPALGPHGIYIGGEHGQLWYVPYDYPLHHPDDSRGSKQTEGELPREIVSLHYVTPGGRVLAEIPTTLPAADLICLKLIVRKNGTTEAARFYNSPFFNRADALQIEFDPPLPYQWEVSGDGRYLYILPDGFFTASGEYRLTIRGSYYVGGLSIGNLTVGGRSAGQFERTFHFIVAPSEGKRLPLTVMQDQVTAFEWTRLAVPIPTMLPSLNQIGFDYMHWLIGVIKINNSHNDTPEKLILWAIGANQNETGEWVVDPETDFRLPLNGRFLNNNFILSNHHFKMAVTGIPIPFNTFQLRGAFAPDLQMLPGARMYAETKVLSIPTFGIPMVIAGLANKIWKKLVAIGTYMTFPYPEAGTANKRPFGVQVTSVEKTKNSITATITVDAGHAYPIDKHLGSILLIDDQKTEVVELDYHNHLRQIGDGAGNLSQIELTIPNGTTLPDKTSITVILDLFPIYQTTLEN